jgi:hypothetical protein
MGHIQHNKSFIQNVFQGMSSDAYALVFVPALTLRVQLGAVELSKNVLRALDASQADLPPLDAFPKSHIVTFKYYVGVICFLDENYAEVY